MEVVSVLTQQQIEVTMIIREDRIWKRFFTPEMSRAFESYFAARGVRFVKEAKLKKFRGEDVVEAVELEDGSALGCEMVVAGIGVRPVTEFLADSGIEVADGVMVNEYLETNVPRIFAAGDVANYQDLLFRKRRRVEHWDNAVAQGQHCGRIMMGSAPHSSTFRISFRMFSISRTSFGAILRRRSKSSTGATCRAAALASGGSAKGASLRHS